MWVTTVVHLKKETTRTTHTNMQWHWIAIGCRCESSGKWRWFSLESPSTLTWQLEMTSSFLSKQLLHWPLPLFLQILSSSCLLPFYWLDPLNTQEPITFRVLRKNAYFTTFCVEESKLYSQIHLSNEMKRSSTTRTAAVMLTWLTCLASSQDIFHHFLPKNNPREASICCLRNARFLLISLVSFVRKRTPTVSEQHSPQILQELLPA